MARTVHSGKPVKHPRGFGSNKLKEIIIPADIEREIQQLAKTVRPKIELTPVQTAIMLKMHETGIGCRRIAGYLNKKFGLKIGRNFIQTRLANVQS